MEAFTKQDKENISAVFALAIKQLTNDPNGVDKNSIYQTLLLEAKLNKFIDDNLADAKVEPEKPEKELFQK